MCSQLLHVCHNNCVAVSKIRKKYLQVWCTSPFWALRSFQMFTGPKFQVKLHLLSTVLLSGFQSSHEFWNSLSKALPGKFYRSGRHSNHNSLQYQANFDRCQAWQIVLVFNTGIGLFLTGDGTPVHSELGLLALRYPNNSPIFHQIIMV